MSVGTLSPAELRARAGAARTLREEFRRPAVIGVAGLTVLAAVLRFYALGRQGFWFDEGNTALLVHFSPGAMIREIPRSESTPPLYYCVAWVWARVFGYGEAPLRSLSALAGAITVPVAFAAARTLVGERAGVFTAALTACNPFLIWYSQEARSYSMLVLLSAVSLLAFAHARAAPRRRTLSAWVIAAALALATHYYAVLAVVPQALWLLAGGGRWRRRGIQVAVALVGLCGLALVPLALSQNRTGHASWIAHFPLGERLGQIIPQFLIGTGAPAYAVLEPLAAAMVVAGLVLLALRAGAVERRAGLAMAGLAIAGLLLNLLLVAGGVDDLLTRNLIVIWLPAAIAVATGLGARRAGWLGVAAAVVLCATGVATTIGIDADWKLQRPDWRAVAAILGPRPAGPGSRVILIQHYRDLLPLSLYEPGLRFWRSGGSRTTSELDVVAMQPGLGERACWWGAACNLIPSQLQAAYRIPGLHELWVRRFRQFSVMRLIAPRPVRLSAAAISGALQSTRLAHDDLLVQG